MKIVVIGAGLIGTSIALGAKRAGAEVQLFDEDGRAQNLANDLVESVEIADPTIVVIATPTSALVGAINRYKNLYPKSTFIDIGSTKTKVQVEVQTDKELSARFCPTHPMAGRELDGAEAAQSDLFVGKSWIITPLAETSGESIALVKELIEKLGARVIAMSPEDHDAAVASISHLPQIISSLLAAQLEGKSPEFLALAGSGVMDTTRIAGSNPDLWREILNLNRNAIEPLLKDFQKDLSTLIENYDVESVLQRGRKGRHLLPGKHRSASRNYTYLPVVLEDKPNQLARLFDECAKANVNVEDITIEHSPEQETGLVLLALSAPNAELLQKHLATSGWRVHPPRSEK
ncbi:MAG: prephenate dehydrogenase [Candidatus Nanopelagicaceae bacterium]|jgi:prephenate dehydrogenase|nr:prephenate dehydrogenase [Candidatus Nanopelagicaceae bacterium]